MSKMILERIKKEKIIAIVRGISGQDIVSLAKALYKGGISCIEITFDQRTEGTIAQTLGAIKELNREMGNEICLGAGTVMSAKQAEEAVSAGAEYIISPNVDKEVILAAKKAGKVSIPGALTPTEATEAWKAGADIIKLFPAGQLGPGYIKALKAPLPHIPVTAVGGITPENCGDFIKAGAIGIGCGGNLVSASLIAEKRFGEITETAKRYRRAVDAAKGL